MKAKISVIIPVYNTPELYLKPSIESVLNQNTDLVEVIIVDDGTTDIKTLEVLEYFTNEKNVMVYHIENKGVSNARNFGINKAKGDYIVFVDADDILLDNAAEKILANHNNADIVCFDYVKNYTTRKQNFIYSDESELFREEQCSKILSDALSVEKGLALCWGKAFKKEFLKQNDLYFDTELVLAEDADFAIRCYSKAKTIYYYKQIMYSYTVSEDSTARRFNMQMPEQYAKSIRRVISTVKKIGSQELMVRAYNFALYHLLFIVVNNVFHPKNKIGISAQFKRLREICSFDCFNVALKHIEYSFFSKTRAITLFLIKNGLYLFVYLIAKFRQATRKD